MGPTAWLFIVGGAAFVMLGGPNWPPGRIDLIDIIIGLVLAGYGVRLLQDETRWKADEEKAQRDRAALGTAFAHTWPDAPDAIVSWIAASNAERRKTIGRWCRTALAHEAEFGLPVGEASAYLLPDYLIADETYDALRKLDAQDVKALQMVLR